MFSGRNSSGQTNVNNNTNKTTSIPLGNCDDRKLHFTQPSTKIKTVFVSNRAALHTYKRTRTLTKWVYFIFSFFVFFERLRGGKEK